MKQFDLFFKVKYLINTIYLNHKITLIYIIFLIILSNNLKLVNAQTSNDQGEWLKIFDGKTLNGWEGDSTYWRVENEKIVGEVTEETLLERNSFLIWRSGSVADFELKVEYRISNLGNSGINYRSEEVKGDPDAFIGGVPYALKGYQADIDGQNNFTGMNYEERGRSTIAPRGLKVLLPDINENEKIDTYIEQNQWIKRIVQDTLEDSASLISHIKEEWNEYHIVAVGNKLKHYVNGVLMSEVTDNDSKNRRLEGLLGVQVHVGPPMKIEYRNFRLKKLD